VTSCLHNKSSTLPPHIPLLTIKAWFHGRFFSAKYEIFLLFLLNCEQSSRNNLFEWSQFKRNRRNNSHFAKKKRSWNQAFMKVINSSPLNRPARNRLFILALFYRDSIKHPFKDWLLIEKLVKVKIKNVQIRYQMA
jgi:hypothetical protein